MHKFKQLFFMTAVLGLMACDRFETPSETQCDQAVSQLVQLDGSGATNSANLLDKAKGQLNLAKEKLTGDFKVRLEECKNNWNTYKANCVIKATDPAQAKACSKWF